jgi:hypothetical protein
MGKGFMAVTAATSALGGFLFGFDIGVIGGCIDMQAFKNRFPIEHNQLLVGFVVSSLTIGCLVGALLTSYIAG